ncbi:hypothetical protein [Liquorilactobacillus satsumensis]|uniref:hypothetical protein n=1 Tax=Liquorilactobacillus satsumensis TaxID=259059 RepID=UPI0039EA1F6F
MIKSQDQFFSVLDQAIPLKKKIDSLNNRINRLIADSKEVIEKQKRLISYQGVLNGNSVKVVYFPTQDVLKEIDELAEQGKDDIDIGETLINRKSAAIDELNPLVGEINEYVRNNVHVLNGLETQDQLEFFGYF